MGNRLNLIAAFERLLGLEDEMQHEEDLQQFQAGHLPLFEVNEGPPDELLRRLERNDPFGGPGVQEAEEQVENAVDPNEPDGRRRRRARRALVERLDRFEPDQQMDEQMEQFLNEAPFEWLGLMNGHRLAVPPRLEELVPERAYVRPFPLKMQCEFDTHNLVTKESDQSWNGLTWSLTCENYTSDAKLIISRLAVAFNGIENNVFKVTTSGKFSKTVMNFTPHEQQIFIVDKDHRTFVFPDIQITGPARLDNGMLEPTIKLNFSVDNIEMVDQFEYRGQIWPMSDRWVSYDNLYSVKIRMDTFMTHNPKFEKLIDDMKNGVLSRNEARAFFEFAGFLCNRWYVSTKKFHTLLMDAFKLGFTENWAMMDTPDSGFDFNTKTLLPFYHDFLNEPPKEQIGFECAAPSGVCQIFKLNMNPDDIHKRNQIETMRFAKGHRGQFTFHLEDCSDGLLLMLGGVFKVTSRQNAKLKVTLFENGVSHSIHSAYRILHDNQRTFGFVVALLTAEQIDMLRGGYLSIGIQLHFHQTENTFVRTYQHEADFSSPYMMPGPCNAWLICNDGKKIGVCKEYLANHCEQLNVMFYNQNFADCGSDKVTVDEKSSTVLLALEILYHRSLAMHFDSFRDILNLAGYWLSNTIKRYVEMAILHTDQIESSDKVELAIYYDLDLIKYIIRHPEYASGCAITATPAEKAKIARPGANELDGGPDGRGPADRV